MRTVAETPFFFDAATNTAVYVKRSKSVVVKMTGHDNNCDALSFGWWQKTATTYILKRKNLLKETLLIRLKCNVKGWMTEELLVKWLTEIWSRRPYALLKKTGMLVLDAFRGKFLGKVKTVNWKQFGHSLLVLVLHHLFWCLMKYKKYILWT